MCGAYLSMALQALTWGGFIPRFSVGLMTRLPAPFAGPRFDRVARRPHPSPLRQSAPASGRQTAGWLRSAATCVRRVKAYRSPSLSHRCQALRNRHAELLGNLLDRLAGGGGLALDLRGCCADVARVPIRFRPSAPLLPGRGTHGWGARLPHPRPLSDLHEPRRRVAVIVNSRAAGQPQE